MTGTPPSGGRYLPNNADPEASVVLSGSQLPSQEHPRALHPTTHNAPHPEKVDHPPRQDAPDSLTTPTHRFRGTIRQSRGAAGRSTEPAPGGTNQVIDSRLSPVSVVNRINKLAADIRRIHRETLAPTYVDGMGYQPATPAQINWRRARYESRLAALTEKHRYWENIRAHQIESGIATDYSPAAVNASGFVKIRDRWMKVLRPNTKTVTIRDEQGRTRRYPWVEVQEYRAPSE